MKSRAAMFLVALAAWCLLSWSVSPQHLIVGAVVSLIVAIAVGDLFVSRPHLMTHPIRYLNLVFVYAPLLAWECVKANFDVAYRVLNPALPVRPGIVRIATSLRSETGLTFLANSITLTPGTMTVDLDPEKGLLYIHWINVTSEDPKERAHRIAGRFEPVLRRIFEEGGR